MGKKQFNLVRTWRTDVGAKTKSCGIDLYLRRIDYGVYKTAHACVYEGERERGDDDEHDDDAVGGCQGVLEYRHRSMT